MRPELVVAVTGTGTEVGKTWVTAAVARSLRESGVVVRARKPAQSFAPEDPPEQRDAAVLAAATGERADEVCLPHRSYAVPMAPPMAAAVLARERIDLTSLLDELTWPAGVAVGFVETAGGVRSPIADDGDNADLVRAVEADVVLLVADAGLGAINLVRLAVTALDGRRVIVILNRYDASNETHRRNLHWLVGVDELDVVASTDEVSTRLRGHLRGSA